MKAAAELKSLQNLAEYAGDLLEGQNQIVQRVNDFVERHVPELTYAAFVGFTLSSNLPTTVCQGFGQHITCRAATQSTCWTNRFAKRLVGTCCPKWTTRPVLWCAQSSATGFLVTISKSKVRQQGCRSFSSCVLACHFSTLFEYWTNHSGTCCESPFQIHVQLWTCSSLRPFPRL